MTIKQKYKELLEENDLDPASAVLTMENTSKIMDALQMLGRVDREEMEKAADVSSELGEILGFTAMQDRISDEKKREIESDIFDLAEKLDQMLSELEGEEE